MAELKKNQLNQILFVLVDRTDFASIESGVTSNITGKFYGVNHGVSTAMTSGAISKTASVVRSGIFRQTLKAAETNYDFVTYRFTHASAADQILVFQTVTNDDSDIHSLISDLYSDFQSRVPKAVATNSQLSDLHSDLRSFLAVMSGVLSDTYSLLSDFQSDFQSRITGVTTPSDIASKVWAEKYTAASNVKASSFGSVLRLNMSRISDTYSLLSDFQSDFQSRVPKRVATDSQLSDLHSDLRSFLAIMSGVVSDTYSLLSDFQSDFQSRIPKRVATDSQLSDLHSDLKSFLAVMSGVLSDTYSGVQVLESAFIGHTGSTASQVTDASTMEIDGIDHDDQFNGYYVKVLGGSQVDELRLIVDTQKTPSHIIVKPAFASRLASGVDFVIVAGNPYQSKFHSDVMSRMSDVGSDLRSYMTGLSATLSDTYSLLSDHHSDFQSRVPKRVATDSQLSDVHSDLRSQIGGITATVSASDISDIASRVWSEKWRVHSLASSFGSLFSVVWTEAKAGASRALLNQSRISDVYSLLSDANSDLRSLMTTTGVALNASTMSDLRSAINAGPAATVTASDISDIASAVWAAKYTAHSLASSFGSLFSDIFSRLVLNQSRISDTYSLVSDLYSDFQSRVPKRVATDSQLSDLHSDLRSYLVGISATLSDVYSLTSDLQSDFQSRVPKRVATDSQLSDLHSDLRSYLVGLSGAVSDIESQLDATNATISDIGSRLPATLSSGRMRVDVEAINGNTAAASGLSLSARTIVTGAAAAGTLSTTQMTTDLTEATNDHYNGRILIWTSGALKDQATDITDYDGPTKRFTYTAITEAPVAGDSFVIV